MDWVYILIGMILWDIVRADATVYWTAHKIKKDRENGHEKDT